MPQYPVVPLPGGNASALNVSTPTLIKATPGSIVRVTVLAAATGGTFGVYDSATVGGAAQANAILQETSAWPAVGTVIQLDFPCFNGIVVNPGTSGAVSVSFR